MFQCVVLSISSDVITFHHRRENARRKNGRIKDKSVRNVSSPIKEGREIREGKGKNKKIRNGKMEKSRKVANDTKPIKKNCIMQSGERAVFSPRFLVPLYKTGRRFCMGDVLTA